MKVLGVLAAATVAGLLVAELVMDPEMGTRLQFATFFVAAALTVAAGVWWFPRWARRVTRLQRTVFVLAVVALLGVGLAVTAASGLMFLSSHDLQLLWIVLGFALVLGIVFAASVARPLTEDLRRIADTAAKVGEGDLDARTGVARPDEVGRVAAALDAAAARLAEVEGERERERRARRAFLTAVGHDLRTPLSALRAAVEALEDGVGPNPEALRPTAEARGVAVSLEAAGRVQTVGGPEALGRVIRNLLDNAIRHSPGGGRVVVRVGGDGGSLVSVVDEGPGFPAGFADRAFGSFTRGDDSRDRSTGGAGLGLAIARGVIEAHGGEIWAEPGPGGRVTFRIPGPGG